MHQTSRILPQTPYSHKMQQKPIRNPPDHQEFHQKHTRATKSTRNLLETFHQKSSRTFQKSTRLSRIPPETHQNHKIYQKPSTRNPPDHPDFHHKPTRTTKPTRNPLARIPPETPRTTKPTRNPPVTYQTTSPSRIPPEPITKHQDPLARNPLS